MSEAGKLFLLANAELRDRWRWARQHLYALLILGPLVLGMTYMTLSRAASYDLVLETPSLAVQVLIAVLSVLAVIALNLSRASREIYHLRQPAIISEALPVERVTHLHLALLARMGRALVFGLVLLVLHSLGRDRLVTDIFALAALLLFVVLIALSEVYAALNWIHWGHMRDKQAAGLALVVLLATAALGGLLLLIFFNPAINTKIAASLAAPVLKLAALGGASVIYIAYAKGCLLAGIVYLLARRSHERWRATDIDYAQRLREGGRLKLDAIRIFNRRMPESVAAMLERDLRLTLRTFSSAVYVAEGLCVLLILMLLILLNADVLPSGPEFIGGLMALGWASATWLPAVISIKLACVLAVAALSSVLPMLVYYQLPHMWLERATGATGECVWKAKLWYARLVTLPVVLLIYTVGVVAGMTGGQGGGVPLYYVAPLLAECLWLWWLASTAVGALAFEIPDRPELSIVLILTVSISTGTLTAVLWPMGLAFYGMGFARAAARGGARARYYLTTEGERATGGG
jgi:hypothetical protein